MKTIHEEEGYAPTNAKVNGEVAKTFHSDGHPANTAEENVKNNFHKILPGQPTSAVKKVLNKKKSWNGSWTGASEYYRYHYS